MTKVETPFQQELNELWAYVYNLKKENRDLEFKVDAQAIEIVKLQNLIQEISEPIDRLNRDIQLYLRSERTND